MKILICGINYAPDLTGIGKYTGEMGSWLAKNGHTVEVITGMPYYPQWQINSTYKKRWWHKEYIDGVKVYRCPLYVPRKVSSFKRIVHEFSFVLSTLPVWIKKLFSPKYDIVISISPPFSFGGCAASLFKGQAHKDRHPYTGPAGGCGERVAYDQQPALLNTMFVWKELFLKGVRRFYYQQRLTQ